MSDDRALSPYQPMDGEDEEGWVEAPKRHPYNLLKLVMSDALYEPDNPAFRRRRCRMIILRSSHSLPTTVSRLVTIYYLLGAVYRPSKVVRIKSYAVMCPEGPAFFTQWLSRKIHGVVMTAAGVPELVADEVLYARPVSLVVPVEQCSTVPEALRRRGLNATAERVLSRGSWDKRYYVCLVKTGLHKLPEKYIRSII